MGFEGFHWLSHHGRFLAEFYFYFSLVCYILGPFLIKQIIPLVLVGYEMIFANSYPTSARGISFGREGSKKCIERQ